MVVQVVICIEERNILRAPILRDPLHAEVSHCPCAATVVAGGDHRESEFVLQLRKKNLRLVIRAIIHNQHAALVLESHALTLQLVKHPQARLAIITKGDYDRQLKRLRRTALYVTLLRLHDP